MSCDPRLLWRFVAGNVILSIHDSKAELEVVEEEKMKEEGVEEEEHLHDGSSELEVRLVHLCTLPHINLQVIPDQGEQGGGEGHPSFFVDWHVHPDQPLVCHLVRTLFPKPKWRVDVLEYFQSLCVVDFTPEIICF